MGGKPLSVDELAELIRPHYRSGMRIVLLSCKSGLGGANSTGARLAKLLRADVDAPDYDIIFGSLPQTFKALGQRAFRFHGSLSRNPQGDLLPCVGTDCSFTPETWKKNLENWRPPLE